MMTSLHVQFTFIHMNLSHNTRLQAIQVNNFKFHQLQHPLNHHHHTLMHTHHNRMLRKAHHHLITIQHHNHLTQTFHHLLTSHRTQCKVMRVIQAPATGFQLHTIHHRMEHLIQPTDHHHLMDRRCQR